MRKFLLLLFIPSISFGACGITQALENLRPGAEWILRGNNYAGLTWTDTVQTKPTLSEIATEISNCQADESNRAILKAQARLDVRNTGLTPTQRLQALLILLDYDR